MTGGDWPERSIEDLETILRRVSLQGEPQDPEYVDTQKLKPGSVMVLFTPTPEGPSIVLTRRSQSVRTHRGEIAFPGGKPELEDKSSVDTALRETEEEIGISRSDIDIWGGLPAVMTVTSGFRLDIHPKQHICSKALPLTAAILLPSALLTSPGLNCAVAP